jgi:hypothetical protein
MRGNLPPVSLGPYGGASSGIHEAIDGANSGLDLWQRILINMVFAFSYCE